MFDVSPTAGMTSPEQVVHDVCASYGLRPMQVRFGGRCKRMVAVRRTVAKTLRVAGHSTSEIGKLLGGLHHTTVMNLLDESMARRKYYASKLRGTR